MPDVTVQQIQAKNTRIFCFGNGGGERKTPHYTSSVLVPLVFCPRFRHSTFN